MAVSTKLAATGKWERTKMHPPKAKSRVVNSYRVSGVDGFKDVSVGPSSTANREQGDGSIDGKYVAAKGDNSHDDVKARAERYGIDIDSSDTIGLGLS